MAKTTSNSKEVTSIKVRMYRIGTGDFFLLQFMASKTITFKMMIDCGCINAKKTDFQETVKNLLEITNGEIDLLVVTHEHADHINGFEKAAEIFSEITFKRVWFAWTEDTSDAFANDLRRNHSEIKMALNTVTTKLNGLKETKYYDSLFKGDKNGLFRAKAQEHFIESINELNELNFKNFLGAKKLSTMEDYLIECGVIGEDTEVEFLSPGDLKTKLKGATGIRFFVLGPPKDLKALAVEGKKGEGYEKREEKSTIDFSFMSALNNDSETSGHIIPFDDEHIEKTESNTKIVYESPENKWREITHDWLYNVGSLALRLESSINNTSLVLAIQFEKSEKVLLFPADAEYGNWESWPENEWSVKEGAKSKQVNYEYLLNNTVLYKIGHHMSQNGSGKEHGVEMMIHEDLCAMGTLDLKKINSGWRNTMPNDYLGAELLKKTKGKLYVIGDAEKILENIDTDRVKIRKSDKETMLKLNAKFDGEFFIDYEVNGK